MSNPTYTPSAQVARLLAELQMPQCMCVEGSECFRVVPEGEGYCVPCWSGYHAHGYGGGR